MVGLRDPDICVWEERVSGLWVRLLAGRLGGWPMRYESSVRAEANSWCYDLASRRDLGREVQPNRTIDAK